MNSGDVRAAFAVLKGLEVLRGAFPPIGAEDPKVLAAEQEQAERARGAGRELRHLTAFALG